MPRLVVTSLLSPLSLSSGTYLGMGPDSCNEEPGLQPAWFGFPIIKAFWGGFKPHHVSLPEVMDFVFFWKTFFSGTHTVWTFLSDVHSGSETRRELAFE